MTSHEAKIKGFTHHGKIYGFDIYLTDDEEMNIEGVNCFNDKMVAFFTWLDITFEINECFAIQIGAPL